MPMAPASLTLALKAEGNLDGAPKEPKNGRQWKPWLSEHFTLTHGLYFVCGRGNTVRNAYRFSRMPKSDGNRVS